MCILYTEYWILNTPHKIKSEECRRFKRKSWTNGSRSKNTNKHKQTQLHKYMRNSRESEREWVRIGLIYHSDRLRSSACVVCRQFMLNIRTWWVFLWNHINSLISHHDRNLEKYFVCCNYYCIASGWIQNESLINVS